MFSFRRCSQVLVHLKVNSTDMVDIVMYTNVSENVQPGTIVTFINVGNIPFKHIFISSELCFYFVVFVVNNFFQNTLVVDIILAFNGINHFHIHKIHKRTTLANFRLHSVNPECLKERKTKKEHKSVLGSRTTLLTDALTKCYWCLTRHSTIFQLYRCC